VFVGQGVYPPLSFFINADMPPGSRATMELWRNRVDRSAVRCLALQGLKPRIGAYE
jgi:hypothetical protein